MFNFLNICSLLRTIVFKNYPYFRSRSPPLLPPPFSLPTSPSPSHHGFASQRPLLAVIFCCENTPDCQTGHGAGISQNNSAVFPRISDIFGVGTPSREDSLRRRSGADKRVGFLPVLSGIPDPQNRPSFISPYSSP